MLLPKLLKLETLEFCDFIGVCENESISFLDTLGYKVNDMYFSEDKIYIANPRDNINSFDSSIKTLEVLQY